MRNSKNINRKIMTVMSVIVLVLGLSAFTLKHHGHKAPKTVFYFQFSGTDAETDYENSAKWTALSSKPAADPCPGADNIVCVLNTSDIASGTTTALVSYLSSLTPAATGATTYCHTIARESYRKP